MKKRLNFALLCACIALGPIWMSLQGCKAPSTQRIAVNTLFSVGKGVDASYRSYLDLVIAGSIKTNNLPRVAAQYAEFQRSFRAALTLVAVSTNSPAPPELISMAASFTAQVAAHEKEDK